jgi:hypothetical protein
MNRRAWVLIVALAWSHAAHAQQSQVSVSAATQVFAADQYRMGGVNRVEPDLGIAWVRPSTLGGNLGLDLNVVRRDAGIRLGRAVLSLRGAKAGGLQWDLTAGDTGTPPFVPDFGFSNLHAPTLTVAGASVSARSERVTVRAAGGRTTQTRNIFGTDLIDLRQTLYQADVTVRVSKYLQLATRGSQVRNGDLGPYPTFVDWAEDIGGGLVLTPGSSWQISADAGVSRFQRRGAAGADTSPSWLVGTKFTAERGRFEINAQRFSVGRFAAMNYPYNDRQGLFASGDWKVADSVRLFGGADVARTNLDPDSARQASVAMPEGVQTRGFGGARIQWSRHSTFTLRAEGGGRDIRASRLSPGFESDTGAVTAEWQGNLPRTTVVTRYERRTNVDANYAPSSFRQHEVSSQVFLRFAKGRELFVQGFMIRRANRAGGGETDWYAGAGLQVPLSGLQFRLEGTVGRTDDWETPVASNRQMIVGGLSGAIARQLFLSADVVLHHAPLDVPGSRPWYTRSMVRVTRTMTYGTAIVPAGPGALPLTGPMGSVVGLVFVDWNQNGCRDADEEPAPGVAVTVVQVGMAAAGDDGHAVFSRVPAGERVVSLDLATVPADYDLPGEAARTIEVTKGKRTAVDFGLLPVGTITGAVFDDSDNDGTISKGDRPRDDAIVMIDDGVRSELVRDGRFRFDNVRLGSHVVAVDLESLEEGAQIAGDAQRTVVLSREARTGDVVFLVRTEKRPEVRKVFPPANKKK